MTDDKMCLSSIHLLSLIFRRLVMSGFCTRAQITAFVCACCVTALGCSPQPKTLPVNQGQLNYTDSFKSNAPAVAKYLTDLGFFKDQPGVTVLDVIEGRGSPCRVSRWPRRQSGAAGGNRGGRGLSGPSQCQRWRPLRHQPRGRDARRRGPAGHADLLGVHDPAEIAFGQNMTTLTFALSRSLAQTWKPGDAIVVTRLDHDAYVTPWVLAAGDAGVTTRLVSGLSAIFDQPAIVVRSHGITDC
ncbi:hypothetical protein BH11PLA2_BH11PLA2_29980 [soil metagenome]